MYERVTGIHFFHIFYSSSIRPDCTTVDDDTDSDDGDSEFSVHPSIAKTVRVLSFHCPVSVVNRMLVPITVRLVPDLTLGDMTSETVSAIGFFLFAYLWDESSRFHRCPAFGISFSSSFLPYFLVMLVLQQTGRGAGGDQWSSKLRDRDLQPGERLAWYHEHWDQRLQLQVLLPGFLWSQWAPIDRYDRYPSRCEESLCTHPCDCVLTTFCFGSCRMNFDAREDCFGAFFPSWFS